MLRPTYMAERDPLDGKPYYCAKCGAGFGEFMACELPDCKLESKEDAEARMSRRDSRG